MIGETLADRYTLTRLLGQGGMGSVYEARHTGTGRRVAIKIITGDIVKHPGLISRFEVEAKAAGAIESTHIAQVLDAGKDEARGVPFLAMEYLEGEDLRVLFQRLKVLPPDLAVCLVAQACLGLGKAHASNVIHRDIKPENMLLTERDGGDLVVKLLDFGIAKIKMDEAQTTDGGLTATGSLLGTPRYMAPEQARGDKSIDHRTDLWSLGVVLFQALTGKTPTDHIDAIGGLILSICTESPGPVQDLAPWVKPELAAIVYKALRLERNERYQSAKDMYRALRALVPQGTGIDSSMVVPLSDEARAVVAPRYVPGQGLVTATGSRKPLPTWEGILDPETGEPFQPPSESSPNAIRPSEGAVTLDPPAPAAQTPGTTVAAAPRASADEVPARTDAEALNLTTGAITSQVLKTDPASSRPTPSSAAISKGRTRGRGATLLAAGILVAGIGLIALGVLGGRSPKGGESAAPRPVTAAPEPPAAAPAPSATAIAAAPPAGVIVTLAASTEPNAAPPGPSAAAPPASAAAPNASASAKADKGSPSRIPPANRPRKPKGYDPLSHM